MPGVDRMSKSVVLVAPFSPGFEVEHLGAAKKIQLVAKLLHGLGYDVHFVDSAHPLRRMKSAVMRQASHVGDVPVTLWRPFSLPNRKLGKLLNIYASRALFRALAKVQPSLVWIYNSYAFEARLGLHLRRHVACPLVLELEDLPLSRHRGLNPKPRLDKHYFDQVLPVAELVTFVNDTLLKNHAGHIKQGVLLPSLLQQALVDMPPRARFGEAVYRLGYFGGLEVDKGVSTLIDLPAHLPKAWKLVVTGVGSLSARLQALAQQFPHQVEFHGAVPHERVLALMHQCDAIVNPHSPIAEMGDGVFPFKVCEVLASGALLITTPLPSIGMTLDDGVLHFDGSVQGLATALVMAPSRYTASTAQIDRLRAEVCRQYGEESVTRRFRETLQSLRHLA